MVRQKSKKTLEKLYVAAPPPSLVATTRFEENFFQNSKFQNQKSNEKTDICIQNTTTCQKKSKGRNPLEKKDQKTLLNEEPLHENCKKTERLQTKTNFTKENDNEKDEDTEEFFGMIKQAVERAVEKSLQEMISCSLKDINMKLDDISKKVNSNEQILEKIQVELQNKIIHYGEENSRHFRYLCMKSEYDKMFYQHQNVITTVPVDARPNVINPYQTNLVLPSEPLAETKPTRKAIQMLNSFPSKPHGSTHKTNFSDLNSLPRSRFSSESPDMGIGEVKDLLEQLAEKFYSKHNHEKDVRKDETGQGNLNVPDQDDSADGDEDDESSDDSGSTSVEENIGAGGDA